VNLVGFSIEISSWKSSDCTKEEQDLSNYFELLRRTLILFVVSKMGGGNQMFRCL